MSAIESHNLISVKDSERLTKRKLRNIKFKERNYKVVFDPKKEKKLKVKYWCELDTYDGIQIIRMFQVDREQKCIEVQRTYIKGNEYLHQSYGCYFNYYSYRYNINTKFEFRNIRRLRIYPDHIKTINVLPEFKIYYKAAKIRGTDVVDFFITLGCLYNDNKLESLAKVNYDLFFNLYLNTSSTWSMREKLEKYLRSFQLISKWGYKVKDRNFDIYLDHLSLVKSLNLDLRSPKYIAPKNLKKAHQELIDLKEKIKNKITPDMEEVYKQKVIEKYHLNCFKNGSGKFTIIPLLTVKSVRKEALEQHNCLFSNEYYKKDDSLLFTSFLDNEKVETIEYDIKDKRIVQSRGYKNSYSCYHDELIKQGNKDITAFLSSIK